MVFNPPVATDARGCVVLSVRCQCLLIVLASALAACGPTLWADCDDATCRSQAAEAEFLKNPDGLLAAVARLADPIEQAALIEQLVYAHPDQQSSICGAAASGSPAALRCSQLNLRPHL